MSARIKALLLGATLLGSLLAAAPAWAVYTCGDQNDDCQCNSNNPFPCCDNGGNCTWWAWEDACCTWGVGIPAWGNANTWGSGASADPDYDVLNDPVVDSIATSTAGYYGHVAFVTAVNGGTITVREMNCCSSCNYGMRTATYQSSFFDSGFVVRANPCNCSSGQTQTDQSGCDNCAERSRGCSDGCNWDAWGACQGGGECAAGNTENNPCGTRCGQETRTCSDSCSWGAWSACQNEGPCAEGDTGSEECGPCELHSHTCDATCQWGAWGECAGLALDAGDVNCDTGMLGLCAAGLYRCVGESLQCERQYQPSAEVCDGLDNNCNGQTDEGLANCHPGQGGAAGHGAGGSGGAAAGVVASDEQQGGCGCRTAPARSLPPWALLGALGGLGVLAAGRRRRR